LQGERQDACNLSENRSDCVVPSSSDRAHQRRRVEAMLRQFPVVAIVGARQVGKTTLARSLAAVRRGRAISFDLESAEDLALLQDPLLALRLLRGLILIDEARSDPTSSRPCACWWTSRG
jgi:predicted AAA+ superfamily ATPase